MNGGLEYLKLAIAISSIVIPLMWAFGRTLLSQFEKRMNERFEAHAELRDVRMKALEDRHAIESIRLTQVVDKLERLALQLPMEYVRREDWIRLGSVLERRMDKQTDRGEEIYQTLLSKIESLIKEKRHGA